MPDLTLRQLTTAIAVGIIGALTILIAPGFVELVTTQANLSDQAAGYVTAWDINAMAATIGLTTFLLHRVDWRILIFVSLGLFVAGTLWSAFSHTYADLVLARVCAGAGEGLAVGVSFAALGRASNPDRAFGIYLVAGLGISGAILLVLPSMLAALGSTRIFFAIAIVAAAVAFLVPSLPTGDSPSNVQSSERPKIHWWVAMPALAGVLLYFIAQGAMWSYFERIGHASGIEPQIIGKAMALSSFSGLGGALVAVAVSTRFRRAGPLFASAAVSLLSFFLLSGHVAATSLILSGALFNFAWNLSQPLLSGLCADADRACRVVCAMGCIQTVGTGLGPAIAASLIRGTGFGPVVWMSSGILIASLIVLLPALRYHGQIAAPVPPIVA
jgi:MFS transporter, DHA1 family, inner membrane transport protein